MSNMGMGHGTPVLREPLPLELANTTHLVRGRLRDDLRTPMQLSSWLREVRTRLMTRPADEDLRNVRPADLAMARDLRDCIHALARVALEGGEPDPEVLDRLNHHARTAPRWRELRWDDHPAAETCTDGPAAAAALSEIAEATVDLFAGPRGEHVRQCAAPDCILYFLRDHPRREWCSIACGNRVRAARHYQRTRRSAGDAAPGLMAPAAQLVAPRRPRRRSTP